MFAGVFDFAYGVQTRVTPIDMGDIAAMVLRALPPVSKPARFPRHRRIGGGVVVNDVKTASGLPRPDVVHTVGARMDLPDSGAFTGPKTT